MILVQHQITNVLYSGVLFTRSIKTNAPYYVINFSDLGDTDGVTSGQVARLKVVHLNYRESEPEPWRALLDAAAKIEDRWAGPLDIEFILTTEQICHILQARPLAANHGMPPFDRARLDAQLKAMERRFKRYTTAAPHLCGSRTFFSDMADWNPSEMIGDRPNSLAYSLYRHIITDEVWHLARTRMGYYDASPGQLMVSFGRKPYIDIRLSFNSLTPSDLPDELREKLVSFYLQKLEANPHLHDKVEHDILLTCYDFGLQSRFEELARNGFSKTDLTTLEDSLRRLTNRIIRDSDTFFNDAISACRSMNQRRKRVEDRLLSESEPWDYFTAASILLSDCRYYGTLPFSMAARMGFIAKQILSSLDKVVSPGIFDGFFGGLSTVASRFREDSETLRTGDLGEEAFFERYGHLRPSTYDICAPRYDEVPSLFLGGLDTAPAPDSAAARPAFSVSSALGDAIDQQMWQHRIEGDHDLLFTFMSRGMRYREWLKFEFTRNLSQALQLITIGGAKLGFNREDLGTLKLEDFWRLRNPEDTDHNRVAKVLREEIERRRMDRERAEGILLPSLICSPQKFFSYEVAAGKPNFVGARSVDGPVCVLEHTSEATAPLVAGTIVLIENADPGYDWLFNHDLQGLITKYGGATSHMAIRCNELDIPAAIGCGELIFERLRSASFVRLDCGSQHVEALGV